MKRLRVIAVLGILMNVGTMTGATAHVASYEWERHECEICGKIIWDKVEFSAYVDMADTISSMLWHTDLIVGDDLPVRVRAETLHAESDHKVCPYCFGKYTRDFGAVVRKAAASFVAEAREKEKVRRVDVSHENVLEELRRVEVQLRYYQEQVKLLNEKLEKLRQEIK
jgi:hypothetical protein